MTLHTRGPNVFMDVLAKIFVTFIVVCFMLLIAVSTYGIVVSTYGLVQLILGKCGG